MSKPNLQHSTSIKPYIVVFVFLGVLTGLTVLLSYMNLPHKAAIFLAGLIALAKCSLIAAYFMHLRTESKGIYALVFGAFFFLAVLILAIIPDIGLIQ